MDLYLLNNKIPISDDDDVFVDGFHEVPGWAHEMSIENRGLCTFYPFEGYTRQPVHGSGRYWNYKESWVKKLVRVGR